MPRPKGFKPSSETRAKISAALTGRTYSAKALANMSAAKSGPRHPFFGLTHSRETRAKMSEARAGMRHPFFGKTHSKKTRAKMSAAHMGKTPSAEARAKMSRARADYHARLRNGLPAVERRVPPERLRELVLRLPDKERALVLARFGFEGPEMTIPEAAASLGLKPSKAKKLYGSALGRLRRWLEG